MTSDLPMSESRREGKSRNSVVNVERFEKRAVREGAHGKGLKEMPGSLRIAIVGGGIGGLTAALALRARGLDVTVFEQAEILREIGAGVSIHPNAARLLNASASMIICGRSARQSAALRCALR